MMLRGIKKGLLGLAITLAFFALLEGVLRLGGVKVLASIPKDRAYDRDSPLVNRCENDPRDVELCPDKFEFRPDTRKILLLGGSSAYGFPHAPELSIAAQLQKALRSKGFTRYEVLNAGQVCKGSDFMRACYFELVKHRYAFDAVVIYEGHNDFVNLGLFETKRAIFLKNHPSLYLTFFWLEEHSALYALLARSRLQVPNKTEHALDSEEFNSHTQLITAFARSNVKAIIDHAVTKKSRVYLITPPSNLYSLPPLKIPLYNSQALDHFKKGQELWAQNKAEAAFQEFVRARDSDETPSRAPSAMVETYRQLGNPAAGVFVVDAERRVAEKYKSVGIGCNLFGDETYCDFNHPNVPLKKEMADWLYQALEPQLLGGENSHALNTKSSGIVYKNRR